MCVRPPGLAAALLKSAAVRLRGIAVEDLVITRRRFLSGLAGGLLAGLYTWRVEPAWVEYVRRQLPVEKLPEALVGGRLVQLSDLHIGKQVDPDYLARTFAAVTALQPDIVVYTGDFVTYAGPETLRRLRRMAGRLPRGRIGTVAVLGNHDYGDTWRRTPVADEIADVLSAAGCQVLRNRSVQLAGLTIGGVEDLWSGRLRLTPLLGTMKPPALMLCHNPDACDLPGWAGYRGWILSGHTHGGQCRPPFLPPPVLPVNNRRYTSGQFNLEGGRSLYINRGLGHLLRVRFNVRPEVTVFQLARA